MYKKIGKCPLCGCDVVDYPRSYGCTNWKKKSNGTPGCPTTIWKNYYGYVLTEEDAQRLLGGAIIGPYQFTTKEGKAFKAKLKLMGGELNPIFEDDDDVDEDLIQ